MSRKVYIIFLCSLLCAIAFIFTGCCDHNWIEANCTAPKTCSKCGETEGNIAHNWQNDSCEENGICVDCGEIGAPVGHIWLEATCTENAICDVCGKLGEDKLGHTTKKGTCSRCNEHIDSLEYVDNFAIVTISDCNWMQEADEFIDICITGRIESISETNSILIIDAENGHWTVDVGTDRDLSKYITTECIVFGSSSGGISSRHDTPLINMSHQNNRIVFYDGTQFFPEDFNSWSQFERKDFENSVSVGNGSVWIPTSGGTKYHSHASCSGMDNPELVTEEEAINRGYAKCGKCW